MAKVMLGVFSDPDVAESALLDLQKEGFNPKDISVIVRDERVRSRLATQTGADVAGGAVSGATTGGALGALAGLLIGLGVITVPGIGGLLIGGPIATALGLTGAAATTVSGTVTGALAGGLVGALVGLGVPKEDAERYETSVKDGAVLVAVPVVKEEQEVSSLLQEYGAEQIRVASF